MRVLVLTPHADDETMGMGGTIARHVLDGDDVTVLCVASHVAEGRWSEFVDAVSELGGTPQMASWMMSSDKPPKWLRDGRLDRNRLKLVGLLDQWAASVQPKVVYLPAPSAHQDHRAVFEAGLTMCRMSLNPRHHWVPTVLVYGELVGQQEVYPTGLVYGYHVDVSGEPLRRKLAAMGCHASQRMPSPWPSNEEILEAEAREIGATVMMPAAERFAVWRVSR